MKLGPIIENTEYSHSLKSLQKLLEEVNFGQYDNFRDYLCRENISNLDLSFGVAVALELSHLSYALRGTEVSGLNLAGNNIHAQRLQNVSLKETKIHHLNLAYNRLKSEGVEKLSDVLKDTEVSSLNLEGNNLDAEGAKNLALALKNTNVSYLNLQRNKLNFSEEDVMALIEDISDTLLVEIKTNASYKSEFLDMALAQNKHKIIQIQYIIACLAFLPDNEKEKYFNLPMLADNSSKNEEIAFAGGIFAASLPDIQEKIMSYLPHMNMKRAKAVLNTAKEYHGTTETKATIFDNNLNQRCYRH